MKSVSSRYNTFIPILLVFGFVVGLIVFLLRGNAVFVFNSAIYATYSPDGRWIITTEGGVAGKRVFPAGIIRDAHTGQEIIRLDSSATTKGALFNHDSTILVTQWTGDGLEAWNTATWERLKTLHFESVACDMDLHPEQDTLIIAICGPSESGIVRVDMHTWEMTRVATFTAGGLSYIAYSPDAKTIAFLLNRDDIQGEISLLDAETYTLIKTFTQDTTINDGAWSRDGRFLFTANQNGSIAVWDAVSGLQVDTLMQDGPVQSIDVDRENRFFIAGGSSAATRYDMTTRFPIGSYGFSDLTSLSLSPDGQRVIITYTRYPRTTSVFELPNMP